LAAPPSSPCWGCCHDRRRFFISSLPDLRGGLVVFILSVCGVFPLFAVFCHHHCGGGSMGGGGLGSAVLGFLLFRFPLLVCFANVLF
jgi:hypothetical protein